MKRSRLPRKILTYFFLFLLSIFTAFPFGWMIITSFKADIEIYNSPPTVLPLHFTLQQYDKVIFKPSNPMITYFTNTIWISSMTIAITLMLSILAGYSFSRYRFRLNSWLFLFLLFLSCIPYMSLLIPIYQFIRILGLLNNQFALVLIYSAMTTPFGIWLMRAYFDSLPKELEEAARMDGCSQLQALFRIILPLSWPVIITVGIFTLLWVWNDFTFAMILLTSQSKLTLSAGLQYFFTQTHIEYGPIMAASTMATIPVFVLFMAVQKFYVKGITAGAVKF